MSLVSNAYSVWTKTMELKCLSLGVTRQVGIFSYVSVSLVSSADSGLKSLTTSPEGCCSGCLKAMPRPQCLPTAEQCFSMEKLEKLLLELFPRWRSLGHQKQMMSLFQPARKPSVRTEKSPPVSVNTPVFPLMVHQPQQKRNLRMMHCFHLELDISSL